MEQRALIRGEPPPFSRASRANPRFRVAASHLSRFRWQSPAHRQSSAACRPLPRRISRAFHAHAPRTQSASSTVLRRAALGPPGPERQPLGFFAPAAPPAGLHGGGGQIQRIVGDASAARELVERRLHLPQTDPAPRAFARRRQVLAQTIGVRQRQLVLVPERSCSPADSRQSVSRGPSDGAGPAA